MRKSNPGYSPRGKEDAGGAGLATHALLRCEKSGEKLMRSFVNNLAACAALGVVIAGTIPAVAAGYPDHAVKVIVPFAAGGPTDVMARLIAQNLSESLKQQFYVEDHAGAGGNIGIAQAARSAPDGYTILVASSSFMVNPSLFAQPPFDALKDFAPVTRAAATPNILVVHPSIEAKNMKDLIALMKASPGKYTIANPGIGTTPQLAGELLKLAYGIDATSVPFGGSGPEIQSAIAGQTPIAFSTFPPTVPHVSSGLLRGLAVTAAKRSATLPDVPTMAEAGIEGQESETMQGVLVPAGTPAEIVALLNREIVKAMQLDDVKAKCAELGFDPAADSPQAFAVYIKQDIEKWGKVIKDAKIQQIQ
jgi:tripartite-type tricarboxylate transporter receptor subunit TctC